MYLVISYFLFLYLFWPFLWEKPIENFLYALNSFSDYNWGGQVFISENFMKQIPTLALYSGLDTEPFDTFLF